MTLRIMEVIWMTFQEAVSRFKEFLFAIRVNIISRIATPFTSIDQIHIDNIEEEQASHRRDDRSKRGYQVPEAEGIWIVRYATRHSSCTQEVHWHERYVNPNEERPEVDFPQ